MTLDDSDSESISCEGVFSRAESLENHISQLKVAIGKDDVDEAEKILQSLEKIDGFLKALNESDVRLFLFSTRELMRFFSRKMIILCSFTPHGKPLLRYVDRL